MCKGISVYGEKLRAQGSVDRDAARFICKALFTTVTNVAWSDDAIIDRIREAVNLREAVKEKAGSAVSGPLPGCATWQPGDKEQILAKAKSGEVRITATENEDVRSLRELLVIGSKGIAAYADYAAILGQEKDEIYGFLMEALASTTREHSTDEMINTVMKAGDTAVHDVTERLSWETQAPLTVRPSEFKPFPARTNWKVEREKMQEICMQCHGENWVKAHYETLDEVVREYNEVYFSHRKRSKNSRMASKSPGSASWPPGD